MQQSAIEHTSQLYTPALSPAPFFVVRSHFHPILTSNNAPNVGAGAAVSYRTHQPVIYTRPFPAPFWWCDRLMAEGSERKKGYLPSFDSDDYSTELSNLAEQICHSPDPVKASKDALNPSGCGKLKEFFRQLFQSSPSI
ncbi:hypothetical protein [Arthrospira platensis]|uniref:hypothetical protein n=2 Tax=Oscillatoriophycideae TaxID=1301283 RepID=UPI0025701775|nr:hypothetical protein [Arthrospira platensis]